MLTSYRHAIRRGFTIVELLIVIVVIAILATITVVSYNGITAKAENVKLLSAVDAYEKALRLYELETGGNHDWPDVIYRGVCLGTYEASSSMPAGVCYDINGSLELSVQEAAPNGFSLNDELAPYLSPVTGLSREYAFSSGAYNYRIRGIFASWSSVGSGPRYWSLTFPVQKDGTCGRGVPYDNVFGSVTLRTCGLDIK